MQRQLFASHTGVHPRSVHPVSLQEGLQDQEVSRIV